MSDEPTEVWLRTSRGWVPRSRMESIGSHKGYVRIRLIGRRTLRPVYLLNQHDRPVLDAWIATAEDFARQIVPAPPRSEEPA